jgi:hypothetical protein
MNGKTPPPCPICGGARWVCESDKTRTDEAAKSGEVGLPCPKCNKPAAELRARRRP